MERKLLQNFGLNHTTQSVYSVILSIGLFIVGFNQNVAAQCSIATSGIVNASTFTCGTLPLSACNGTLTVGDGISVTSIYMNAEMNLTCLGAIQVIVKNKGSFDFSPGNNRLLLAEGSSITFEPGSDLLGGSCNASERIYIGTNLLASCNGGSGADLSFDDLKNYGGTGSLASNSPVCEGSQITLIATPPPTSSGTFTYSFSGPGLAATTFSSNPTYSFTATAGSGGTYQVRIKNSGITNPMVAEISVVVNTLPVAPTITAGGATTLCSGGSVTLTSSVGTGYLWSTGATTQNISATTSGSYTVQVTNAAGCLSASSAATVVTVNPSSAIVLTSGTQSPTVCSGTAITNTVYTFSGSATNASVSGLPAGLSSVVNVGAKTLTISGIPSAGGTYTITTSGHTAPCTAATISGTVAVNASPNNVINGFSATTICVGGSPQLTYNAEASSFSLPYSITYRNDITLLQYTIAIPSSSAYSFTPADNPTSNTGYTLVSISNASCTTTTAAIVDSGANLIVRPIPTVTISGTTSVCVGAVSPNITFTNPQTVAVTVTYTVNGSVNQTINIAASSSSNISVATTTAGTFIYNLVSVVYQSTPNCSNTLSGSATVTVNPNLPASVSISASPLGAICSGTSVTFTAAPTNGGTTPSYQWKLNGVNVSSNSTTYTNAALANSDVVTCVMTSNATPCLTGSPATSNTVTMTVNPNLPASVSVSASPSGAICSGTSVTFTATPTNGGVTPTYQWYNGASLISGQTASTYTSATLSNSDAIKVVMTSNATPCLTGSPATSNTVTMTVNPNLPASVSILASPSGAICSGTSVTFTATPTNGGAIPTYQWYNGASLISGQTASTYTSATLSNSDAIKVVMTSNASPCLTGSPATSNTVTMTVNPNLPASVSISASPSGAICSGTSVTFTATPTNGGTTPTYQWYNGASLISGQTASTYTSATLSNSDAIKVVMTSNATPCLTGSPATSNTVTMTVNPNLPANVSISASPLGAICSGTSVTFTAIPTNGGTAPSYQWKLNGVNVGSNLTTYTNATLTNGDVVSVEMTSNASPCLTGSPVTSGGVTMSVNAIPSNPIIGTITQPTCSVATGSFTITNYNASYIYTIFPSTGVNVSGSVVTAPAGIYSINAGSLGCTSANTNFTINIQPVTPSSPLIGTKTQPTCTVSTGSVVLSGLPASGNIVQTGTSNATYGITGTSQTIAGLAVGNYNFSVDNGSCISTASANVGINNLLINTYSGTWSSGVPTSDQHIVFASNFSSTSDIQACSCQVNNSANVVINSVHTLTVHNSVAVQTSGSLTFENNASLVQINDAAVNTGNINYKRYTTPVRRYDFTYWSSPVVGQTLYNLSPNTLRDKYYGYNSVTNSWVIYYNGAKVMDPGIGYLIRAPETFSITTAAIDTNPMFIGVPNNGVFNLILAGNKSYLLGNPYPSAINADVFLDVNSTVLEGTLYFWTHNSPPSISVAGDAIYNYTSDDYATYNRTGGVSTGVAAITGGQVPNGKIAAGQGFFAPASAGGGTLVFNNSMRISGGISGTDNSQFFKLDTASKSTTANVIEKSRIWLNLSNKEGLFKQTLIGYITGATNNYDSGFDGMTYDGNQYADFYSVSQGINLSIQGRALPFVQKDSVVLGYKSAIKGDFQIAIDHSDGELTSQAVFLEDKILNVLYDLRKEPYSFSTEKGVFNNRFVLRYENSNMVKKIAEKEAISDEGVIVSVSNNEIKVSSSGDLMAKIIIYDILGKVVYQKDELATTDYVIQYLNLAHQVLFVDVVLENEKIVSTKIVY